MEAIGKLATNGVDVPAGLMDMPKYRSHKTVWALKIAAVVSCGTDTTTDENQIIELHFEGASYAPKRIGLRGKPTPESGWYMVQYEDGYVSFSPAPQFEAGNTLEPSDFRGRVKAEKSELDEKIEKLDSFRAVPFFATLAAAEQDRLNMQLSYMRAYSGILADRIAAF
jgi:hypothetical protein